MDFSGFNKPAFGSNPQQTGMQNAMSGAMGGNGQTPAAPPKKKRNFWLDQVSTATGTLGAIGGGLLGAAGGAGIGAVPGAAIGGAAGGGLGEWIENLIDPEGGNTGNIFKEAALSGVMGAGPGTIAKAGGKTLLGIGGKTLAKEGTEAVGKTVLKGAEEAGVRTATERGAQKLLGNSLGIKTGAKVGGETLTPQTAKELQQFVIKQVGIPKTASADMAAERLVNFQKLAGQNIDDIIKTSDRALSPDESAKLISTLSGKVNKIVGVNPTSPNVARLVEQAGEPKTVSDLIKYRRGLDEAINYSRNAASPDPVLERAAKAIRGEVDTYTSKIIPGLKEANTQYSRASHALDYILPNAKNPRGINIMNNKIGGTIAQRGQSLAGSIGDALPSFGRGAGKTGERALGFGSNATQQASSGLLGLGGVTNRGIIGRNAIGALGANSYGNSQAMAQQGQGQDINLEDAIAQLSGGGQTANMIQPGAGTGTSFGDAAAPQQSSSPYTRANLMADLQRDPKNAQKYIEYYASLDEIFNPKPAKGMELGNTAIQSITDLQTGIDNLGGLEQEINSSGANSPGFGGLRSKNPFDTEAKGLRAEIDRVKQVVGKALEGGVLRKEDEEKYARILPTINDTDEVANKKIAAIRRDLTNKLQTYYSNNMQYGGGGSLTDALMSAQPQQQGAYY